MDIPQRNPLRLSNATIPMRENPDRKPSFSPLVLWRKLQPQPHSRPEQDYLLGLRGFLTIQSFLWIFLQTFAPATVKDSLNTTGPVTHLILRKIFSVIFWNESLIYSWFIILSARSICIPFMLNQSEVQVASSAFRRGLRLLVPTGVALALVCIVFGAIGRSHITDFKTLTRNVSFDVPYKLPGFVGYMNSVFNLFWVSRNFASQAGSRAFPGQTLWIVNVLYAQSYTIFMTMVIMPYTRNQWRVKALLLFILTAWWVQSWAWFSVTGLLVADVVMNMDFKARSQQGVKAFKGWRIPSWILYMVLMAAGSFMLFVWAAWKPGEENGELRIHTAMYDDRDGLNNNFDLKEPQARSDNYLFILGFLLLLESSDMLQLVFKISPLVYLGRRSFGMPFPAQRYRLLTRRVAWFLVQSIILYSAGIKLFLHLHMAQRWAESSAVATCLLVCLLITVPVAEGFYRLIEIPSELFAKSAFDWIRE